MDAGGEIISGEGGPLNRSSLALASPDQPRRDGTGLLLSLLLHVAIVAILITGRDASPAVEPEPVKYVELAPRAEPPSPPVGTTQQRPREIIDAPGPSVDRERSPDAPLSDADRRASTPQPTGDRPVDRPGTGSGLDYSGTPGTLSPPSPAPAEAAEEAAERSDATILRPEPQREQAPPVNWRAAIEQASVSAPAAPPGTMGRLGGEQGFAASGPVSFETSWYPWGEYALTMLRRIRYYWYQNMPDLIRLGIEGHVSVRFTIQRDGTITDITTLRSSGSPPYDFAARKAISLSSALPPLPEDFPGDMERVTIGFFYNMEPPKPREETRQ